MSRSGLPQASLARLGGGGGVSGRNARWAVAALTALALALRFYRIGHQSLWVDELLTLQAAELGGRMSLAALFSNVQGPLHALLVHAVGAVSRSEAALRSVSAVASAGTVPIVYMLGTELADRRAGLLTALLVAVSPFSIWYGQEVRNYALLMFFAALSTLLIVRLSTGRSRAWAGYVASTTLGLYCNLAAIFLLAAHGVFVLGRGAVTARAGRNWLRAAAVSALLFVPSVWGLARWARVDDVGSRVAVAPLAEEESLLRGGTTFTPMAFPYAFFAMCYGYSLGPGTEELHTRPPVDAYLDRAWLAIPGLAAALAALLGLRALSSRPGAVRLALSVLLVPAVGAAALAFLNIKPLNARYLSVGFPVLMAVCGGGIGMLRRAPAALVGGVFLGFAAVSVTNYYTRPEYSREDVRGAARYVEARERPGDVLLVPVVHDVFRFYYGGASDVFVIYSGQADSDDEVARRVRAGAAGRNRLWFVESRLWHTDPAGRIPAFLERSYPALDESELAGVRLKLYDVGSSDAGES